jgi:DNA-binding transcriptional ArsR family regulator
MKKIEYIWRELLIQTLEKREPVFGQQALTAKFGLSSSTVSLALSPLRKLGAVRIGKRHSEVTDYEKILYHWANHRHLEADIAVKIRVGLPMMEIEGRLPENSVPTGYTAVRERFGEPPSDYDKVYCYHSDPEIVVTRFSADTVKGEPNLFIIKADPFLGLQASLPQTFVDLWNMQDWYAKDFCRFIKSKLEEKIS